MKVLAVAAHPDDEVLGCGGTLRKHVLAGDEVSIFLLSGLGAMVRDVVRVGQLPPDVFRQAGRAANVLGGAVVAWSFPDQRFETVPLLEITERIETESRAVKPDIVYTHSLTDLNLDHVLTVRAVLTACRPQGGCTVKRLLSFEVPSSTEWGTSAFHPTVFSRLTKEHMDAKVAALCEYAGELRPAPHPRSVDGVRALASWRGATVGAEYAEAFALVREVVG